MSMEMQAPAASSAAAPANSAMTVEDASNLASNQDTASDQAPTAATVGSNATTSASSAAGAVSATSASAKPQQGGKPRFSADEDEEMDSDVEEEGEGKAAKHRFAVVFGYVGANYQGLQKNPGAHTIEDELETAIFKAGLIEPENHGQLAKVGWNRAARTDKGVHAAGQVVSLRMRVKKGEADATRERINSFLPADIRVVDIVRVTRQFNSKNLCSGRRYGYILPTFTLAPRPPIAYVAKAPPMSEAMKQAVKKAQQAGSNSVALAQDPFCNGTAFALGRQQIWDAAAASSSASSAAAAGAGAGSSSAPAGSGTDTRSDGSYFARGIAGAVPLASHATAASASSPSSSAPDADDYQTGAAMVAAAQATWASMSAAAEAGRTRGFRCTEAQLASLREMLAKYKGTHAFHNFSPRISSGDATAMRYIVDCTASKPFLVGSGPTALEYTHITIVGQSFLLNQIRHMVGLAVDVVRGAAPPFAIDLAFSSGGIKLPIAPAEGLYLDQCFFVAYDRKWGRTHPSMTVLPPPAMARMTAFKEEVIWPHIHRSTGEDSGAGAADVGDGNGDDDAITSPSAAGTGAGAASSSSSSLAKPPAYKYHSHGRSIARGGNMPSTGRPFHVYIDDLNKNPMHYRFKPASELKRGDQKKANPTGGTANGGGRGGGNPLARLIGSKRPAPSDDDDGDNDDGGDGPAASPEGADEAGSSSASAGPTRYDIDAIMAPAVAPDGGAVSRLAKEKAEHKRRLKEERERMHANKRAKYDAKQDSAAADGDAGDAGDNGDGDAAMDAEGAAGADDGAEDNAAAAAGGNSDNRRGGRGGGRGGSRQQDYGRQSGGYGRMLNRGGGRGGGRGGRGAGGGGGGGGCFKCGQTGHWSKECPTSAGGGGAPASSLAAAPAPAAAAAASGSRGVSIIKPKVLTWHPAKK